MRSFEKLTVFAAGLLALVISGVPDTVRADNMMTTCEPEIATICEGVSKGRGRISACLYANENQLSGACKSEVDKVTGSSSFQRYISTDVQSAEGEKSEANLRNICSAEVASVCNGVTPGNGRTLACVYSHSKSVSKACWDAARTMLN